MELWVSARRSGSFLLRKRFSSQENSVMEAQLGRSLPASLAEGLPPTENRRDTMFVWNL